MIEEERRHHWLRTIGIILATLIGAFLAFYCAADMTFNRILSPDYNFKRMERIMKQQEKTFHQFDKKFMDNPFEPKMAPMLVNLVKEANEYKIIVDLKPLGNDEKNLNINLNQNVITVSGEMEKVSRHGERIINFSQSYYLDEDVDASTMTKEKNGDKYIITLPFKD